MRQTRDLLVWAVVIAGVWGAFLISSPPDNEAMLGIPACAGRPHTGPCRICVRKGSTSLPLVIDSTSVRFVNPRVAVDEGG